MFKQITVVINPASGPENSILKTLNRAFRPANIRWDVLITQHAGDGRRLARKAVADGAEVVGVYGGDGTVTDVASGLLGTDVPLAIFPGGTANVMSIALGIPSDLAEACALACGDSGVRRSIDMGQVGRHYFLLRVGIGFEAVMISGADRAAKDRMGRLAYVLSAFDALLDPQIAKYTLTLDGARVETEGVSCIVANSGSFGIPGLSLSPRIDITDGLLDVIVVSRNNLSSLVSLVSSVAGREKVEPPQQAQQGGTASAPLHHWQAREIRVSSHLPQKAQADGEIVGETPIDIRVIPQAVQVIVPQSTR